MTDLSSRSVIRTPDQRLRVFVSSTLQELADERTAAREAITELHLAPVLFELGARPHPPRDLYRAYLEQSHIFVGIYWQRYGWVAPGENISGLEDEYRLSGNKPKLIYIKTPAPAREPRLKELIDYVRDNDTASYKYFSTAEELRELIANDLALMLTERFEIAQPQQPAAPSEIRRSRSSLPMPPTRLIDRMQEVAAVCNLLLRDDVSLVTLTGAGGTGKTRLGLQVAMDLLDPFADGVFFVNLAPIRDPDLVASAIAQTLNVRETGGGRPLRESLKDYLRNKQLLLLLDNFEQVVSAAPLLAEVIETCPRLKVLVSSRMPLRVRGEKEFPVPPLALPERERPMAVGADLASVLSQYAAVELFIQRARDIRPDFSVTDETALAVAEICQRLDGLPLAIELAAARVKMLPAQALLARLERRLDLLTSGARDLPARQQTLRSAIAWSYDLLDENTKTLFRRLAVFAGEWTLEAAEAVCNLDGDPSTPPSGAGRRLGEEVLDEIVALVDNSLSKQTEGPNDEPRFGMLETIREYALERLIDSGEADIVRARHAGFFLKLAEQAEPHLTGGARKVWLASLEAEHDNLRAALAWSMSEAGDPEIGLRLAGALAWFWFFRGFMSEGRYWLDGILARAELAPRTVARGKALYAAGALAFIQGDYAAAQSQLELSLAIYRAIGPPGRQGLAYSLTFMGFVGTGQNNHQTAQALFQESLDILWETGDRWLEAFTRVGLGYAKLNLGDLETARSLFEESLAQFRALGDAWGQSMALNAWGGMARVLGDYAVAQSLHAETVTLMRQEGDRWGLSLGLVGLGYVTLHQGDLRQAQALFEESLVLWRDLGSRSGLVLSLAVFSAMAVAQGQPLRAARLLGATDALSESSGFALYAADRIEYERSLDAARAQLDEATFAAAYAEGRAMTLEQAIDYVLREVEQA